MLQWMGRDLNDFLQHAESVSDITVMSLDDLKECKLRLGRRKDISDVTLIKRYNRDRRRGKQQQSHFKPELATR